MNYNTTIMVEIPQEDKTLCLPNSFIMGFIGDCLDSANSPIRVKSGSKLLAHPISAKELSEHIGKLITFVLDGDLLDGNDVIFRSGVYNTKYLSSVSSDSVEVKCFNPIERAVKILPFFVKFFVVDKVYTPQQVESLGW